MGKFLLIVMMGFAITSGLMTFSKNRRALDASHSVSTYLDNYSVENAATSGMHMALARLYEDKTWRTGYSNLVLNGDTINVVVKNDSIGGAPNPNHIRIEATGHNGSASRTTEALVFDSRFTDFAVWAKKDSATAVITKTSGGTVDSNLKKIPAPFMPRVDYAGLVAAADYAAVGSGPYNIFEPGDHYPDASSQIFMHPTYTYKPKIIHVDGNLRVLAGRTIWGIYIVEGHVALDNNARINGIVYQPNESTFVYHEGAFIGNSIIDGGVITWGGVSKDFSLLSQTEVRFNPQRFRLFVSNHELNPPSGSKYLFNTSNPPIRVLSWQ